MMLKAIIPPLRTLAEKCGVFIGAAVYRGQLKFPEYAYALKLEFNILTTENALKLDPVHHQPNMYSSDDADYILVLRYQIEHSTALIFDESYKPEPVYYNIFQAQAKHLTKK